MNRIKKNDIVTVLSGKDKGKSGKVLEISLKKDKVLVKDVAFITRHYKAKKQGEISSRKKRESFIWSSNVMPVCSSCKRPVRVAVKILENSDHIRICGRCKKNF